MKQNAHVYAMRSRPRLAPLVQALCALGFGAGGLAGSVTAATITVNTPTDETTANGNCSLREAIGNANNNAKTYADCAAGTGEDRINFDPVVFPTDAQTVIPVTLGGLLLSDGNATTIDGDGGVTVDGGGSSSLFETQADSVTNFKSLKVRNGLRIKGGALYNEGSATIDRSTLSGNTGTSGGGAIYSPGPLTITESTISGNTTSTVNGSGGGIDCYVCTTVSITNSTITGNAAARGGGIYKHGGQFSMINVTLADNSASVDGPQLHVEDTLETSIDLVNTIISGAPAGNCLLKGGTSSVHDHGGNLDDGTTCFATPASGYSHQNAPPHLTALADYGGATLTRMPTLQGSAVDAGRCDLAPPRDQRSVPRPHGYGCDSGAVELVGATITVNTAADEAVTDGKCSLREAIYNTNSGSAHYSDCRRGLADDTIVFDPVAFPQGRLTTITTSAPLEFLKASAGLGGPTTIDGRGAVAIDGGGTHQILVTTSYNVLKGLTLRNGHAAGGGAILNAGLVIIEQCTISGNSADQSGGAIANSGEVLLRDSTLSGNSTSATGLGGAIYSSKLFTVSLENSTISGNAAFKGGGMFVVSPGGQIDNSTIASNSAQAGSAIYFGSGSLGSLPSVRDSIITGGTGGSTCAFSGLQVPVVDLGGNIDDGNSCGFALANGSKPITNPLLGPLRTNGGPTLTMRPMRGSPAIDSTATCETSVDQRGVPRPQGLKCDSGSVESDDVFETYFEPPNTCMLGADCPLSTNECVYNLCSAGACSMVPATIGAFCTGGQCDGMGKCQAD